MDATFVKSFRPTETIAHKLRANQPPKIYAFSLPKINVQYSYKIFDSINDWTAAKGGDNLI